MPAILNQCLLTILLSVFTSGEKYHPCPNVPDWYECPTSDSPSKNHYGMCVSESQLCDGRTDCFESG